jgi:Cu+-exporting ATPase
MTCTNCALSISKYLNKQGLQNVAVNAIDGSVIFDASHDTDDSTLKKGIEKLGYHILDNSAEVKKKFLDTPLEKFLFCLPFTLVLMLHMLPVHIYWLMNGWVQMLICLPVFILGMSYFGVSALKSIRGGVPNMNVLIALGAAAAFIYSLTGTIINPGENYLYFESCATIITLVFLGHWLEDKAIQTTQQSLNKLTADQTSMANMIAFDDKFQEQIFPVESKHLKSGDLILIKSGEQVPADCKILNGSGLLNEALLTGESLPVKKIAKDLLIGGSILEDGLIKAQVTTAGDDSILSKIIFLAKQAQAEKPKLQQLADRISAVFVPAVLLISLVTILINYFAAIPFSEALMRGIAVLVIACPCAMGLATPAAIAVGLGRGVRNGIIFKDAKGLELFKDIRQVVFDKTGTLTNGKFKISAYEVSGIAEEDFKSICFSMEKISNHPIAKSIMEAWRTSKNPIRWKSIEEIKGSGIKAIDASGNVYKLGSSKFTLQADEHHLTLTKNDEVLGSIAIKDEVRDEAKAIVNYFEQNGVTTYLLSGDKLDKCKAIADELGIKNIYAEQSPQQKMEVVAALNRKAPTAMIGDGINDAAALAKATIGVSLGEASNIAVQNAQLVLIGNGLKQLPFSFSLGRQTFLTIRQNLFWAFIYNIVAIPVAAFGVLTPGFAALAMGFSDVVLAVNSLRLRWKKLI